MVGDLLRQKREEKGLTIKDVEQETNIRSLYIKAIEENNNDVLPGEAYVKGFIKNYANFLGMDEAAVVAQYKAEHGAPEPADQPTEEAVKQEQQKRSAVNSSLKEKMAEQKKMPIVSGNGGMGKKIIAGIGAVVILGGLYMAFSSDDQPTAAPQTKQTQQTKQMTEKKAEPAAAQKKPADAVEISVKFTDRCWTEVTVDNKVVYEGTAKKGDALSWKGKDSVKITAGNAGAIDVSYNGQDTGALGNVGDVITKIYNKDGVQSDKKDTKDTKQEQKANQKK